MRNDEEHRIQWCEGRMQYALTRHHNLFSFRRYAVVPNVSWGLGLDHEADLVCLSLSNVFHEIEIKVSLADLRADKNKRSGHYCRFIRHLWFAIPETEIDTDIALGEIPEYSGLVVVRTWPCMDKTIGYGTKIIRRPRPKRRPGEFKDPEQRTIIKFLRLGVLRMWTQKREEYER